MTPIKHRILYIFRGSLLRLRISWNHGQQITLSVGYHVDRTDAKGNPKWDGSRCRVNTLHGAEKVNASVINRELEKLEHKIEEVFSHYEKFDLMPAPDELRDAINGVQKPKEKPLFIAFDEFIEEGKEINQWSLSSIRKMKTMKRLLQKFSPELKFSDLNSDFMKRFMAFQTKNAVIDESKNEVDAGKSIVKYKGRYQNDTINKNMKNIRWFIRWAADKGYIDNVSFLNVKTAYKTVEKPIIFLTWDELMRVYQYDFSNRPELDKTRDMFCFCCFTSLRYSDMINLKWSNVHSDYIRVVTKKTADAIIIDLNDYSREILTKYHKEEAVGEESVFKSKSSQKMNIRLKEIAKMCGIDTPVNIVEMYGSERKEITVPKYSLITTHCGRRTFISNAISMGIAPNIVMKWTGHSDYKAMQPYIAIADKARKESMESFNKK